MTNREQYEHYSKRPASDVRVLAETFKGRRGTLGEALLEAAQKAAVTVPEKRAA